MSEKLIYIKTKYGSILKCYVSEQMHKPIYHPVNSKTNGYVDYNDVERKLDIEDMYLTVKELQQENTQLKQQLKDKDEKINKIEKLTKQLKGSARYERCMDELDYILNIIKED